MQTIYLVYKQYNKYLFVYTHTIFLIRKLFWLFYRFILQLRFVCFISICLKWINDTAPVDSMLLCKFDWFFFCWYVKGVISWKKSKWIENQRQQQERQHSQHNNSNQWFIDVEQRGKKPRAHNSKCQKKKRFDESFCTSLLF